MRICSFKNNSSRNICLLFVLVITDDVSPRRMCRLKDPQPNCYRCDVCFKFFTRRDHLRTHKKNLHGEDAGPFACIVCSQLYKNIDSLRKHIAKFHVTRADAVDKKKLIWCSHYYSFWILEFVWKLQNCNIWTLGNLWTVTLSCMYAVLI